MVVLYKLPYKVYHTPLAISRSKYDAEETPKLAAEAAVSVGYTEEIALRKCKYYLTGKDCIIIMKK